MTYGFIGLGNMAGAILRGMSASGKFAGDTVYGYNRSPEKTRRLAEETGLIPCESPWTRPNALMYSSLRSSPR